MDYLQYRVAGWVRRTFGMSTLQNRKERALRLVEEAVEFAQAVGVEFALIDKIVPYVYGRPAGEVEQELGGVATTLFAAAESCGVQLSAVAEREVYRVEMKDPNHFRKRNAEKRKSGVGLYVGAPDA
jgi:NTP pyrophosphatase (non-canonical NTP hydrolase)